MAFQEGAPPHCTGQQKPAACWGAQCSSSTDRSQGGGGSCAVLIHASRTLALCLQFPHGSQFTLGSLLPHSGIDRHSWKPTAPVPGQGLFSAWLKKPSSWLLTLEGVPDMSPWPARWDGRNLPRPLRPSQLSASGEDLGPCGASTPVRNHYLVFHLVAPL